MSRKMTILILTLRSDYVLRGGCWVDDTEDAPVANRGRCTPHVGGAVLGFRVIVEIPCPEK